MTAKYTITTRGGHPDFLDLPWGEPLAEWDHSRIVKMAHGISRHVVRFVRYDERVYALKETETNAARDEYHILIELQEEHLPVVQPVGIVDGLGEHGEAMLITRYLDYSLPYWYLLGRDAPALSDKLIDAAVVLLVRLHLENVFWGDFSLSNVLFRRDAGALMAYLVDAETSERTESIGTRMREHDVTIAQENIIGGLLDLQSAERVPPEVDPVEVADTLRTRYERLWNELTLPEEFDIDERWRIERRIRQINDLGFDVEELSIGRDGGKLRIKPVLVEEGHHSRELRRRTGLDVQENQARRLLADIARFGAWMERDTGRSVPAAVAAARWLADVYEPVVESIPGELRARLEAPEIFHQFLENRYYMAERLGREVSHVEAVADYMANSLSKRPLERELLIGEEQSFDANSLGDLEFELPGE